MVNLSFNCCYLENCNKTRADSWIFFRDFNVCKSFALFLGKYTNYILQTQQDKRQLHCMTYSWEHGISHTNLYVTKKKLSSLSFIVIIINHDIYDHD
jgi:hypothetical protein